MWLRPQVVVMVESGATWLLRRSPVRAPARATGYEMTTWASDPAPTITICRVLGACRFWPLEMSKPSPGPEPLISSRLQKALTFRDAKSDKCRIRNPRTGDRFLNQTFGTVYASSGRKEHSECPLGFCHLTSQIRQLVGEAAGTVSEVNASGPRRMRRTWSWRATLR